MTSSNGNGLTAETTDNEAPKPAQKAKVGTVYLVGAGPGDPELLTLAGADALQRANVVVYDKLANPALLKFAGNNPEIIFAGKSADRHTLIQEEINALLAAKAREGKTVVRLKGGDPFIFGRGGEEAEYLVERGIRFVVIPGISSAIAAPAYAGIPVTHRDASSSFAVITGHERSEVRESGTREAGEAEGRRRWDRIANAADTLIFLMGVESIDEIASRLIENGRDPETPVAMVRWGTWAGKQETLVSTLGEIAQRVKETGFKAPAVTVVGEVVRWREKLRWWDNRPLFGKKILVTRARDLASELVNRLASLGAETVEFPTIKIVPPADDYASLDDSLAKLKNYDWLIFTSASGVDAFVSRLQKLGKDSRHLGGIRVAAVGPSTSFMLKTKAGIIADFTPDQFVGEEVAREFPGDISGQRLLVPRALEAKETLPEILLARGAQVDIVSAYETVTDSGDVESVRELLENHEIDTITFTSSSTVKNFAAAFGPNPPSIADVALACIGPSTAQTAREILQREPEVIAQEHTIPGLIDALIEYYA